MGRGEQPRRRRRAQRDAAATMSLVAHLRELRTRVALALLFVAIGTAVCFWWYDHGLGALIRAPYCAIPAGNRALGTGSSAGDCTLLVTDVFGGAVVRLKIAAIAGVVVSAPLWLFQVWRFITPGLERNEKRYGLSFLVASITLFALGAVLAYYSLRAGLALLLGLAGNDVAVALTAKDYLGFVVSVLLAFGVSFEVPLLAVALNLVGVLSYAALASSRRWIFFLTIVFAAFVTPTQDPFTMLLMALPMCVLFEIAIQIARVVDRRRARRADVEHFRDLPDDEPSPLEVPVSAGRGRD
jgi:sec-independent protein translocase protein TatC